jgi:hypothetical protein
MLLTDSGSVERYLRSVRGIVMFSLIAEKEISPWQLQIS